MNAGNETNVTSTSENIPYNRIIDTINATFLPFVLVMCISCVVILSVRIKNRRRKLKQLKCSNVTLTFEEEEKLKWDVYNENTFLVKEIYLLLISISEISLIGTYVTYRGLYILMERVADVNNSGIFELFPHIPKDIKCRFYENPIPIIIEGFLSVLLHINILLLCALTRYLTNRYLLRKTNRQLPLLSYGLVSSLIILLFYNKYTQSLQCIAYLSFLVDWFILVRCGRKLSLVLIGRVRELQQCYGNGIMYRQEYQKYRSFKTFNFLFCLGLLIVALGAISHSATEVVLTHKSYCNSTGIEIRIDLTHTERVILMGILYIEKIIASIGLFVMFTPALVYSFGVIIRFCTERCKKKNFHDEMIRPLIDRYQSDIIH